MFTTHMLGAANPGLMPQGAPAAARPLAGERTVASFNAAQPAAHRAATFSYPIHIERASIDSLPQACGVYVLRGANDMPLYVGRSLNLRGRVLAQLNSHDEQMLVRQTRRVEHHCCAGEIGAELIEAQLLRELRPLHNKKARDKRLFTLRLDGEGRPGVAPVSEHEVAARHPLFGVFASERAAQEALHQLVAQHGLCSFVTGLEPSTGEGMACFGRQIRRCRGACTGEESHHAHQQRLSQALEELRILPWPFAGRMGIVEDNDGLRQVHVIDQWRYLGTLDHAHRQLTIRSPQKNRQGFDLDSYKIIIHQHLLGQLAWSPVPA
jgi:excinuclease Cho